MINEPNIKFITNRNVELTKPFKDSVSVYGIEFKFDIPKGFVTDGASIPDIFWGFPFKFTPFQGETFPAAVVHDYLYDIEVFDKVISDEVFYQLMKKYDTPKYKRTLYYLAVHWFGRYSKHKRNKKTYEK